MRDIVSLAIFASLFSACGGGGGGGGSTDQGQQAELAQGEVLFEGILVDFKSKKGKEGVDLLVLNNDTGEPLDLVKYPQFKSGPEGKFQLVFPSSIPMVAFKAWGKDVTGFFEFKETYLFNVLTDAKGKRVYAVDKLTYVAALSTCYVVEQDPKVYGHVAGTIYWVDSQGNEEFVGCLRVQVLDEKGEVLEEKKNAEGRGIFASVRYFDTTNDMPTSLAVSDMTHLLNSRYLVANLPDGKYTVRAILIDSGEVLGEVAVRAFPGGISVGNIYLMHDKYQSNPTPPREECKGKEKE